MRIEWLGHATFFITSEDGTKIITDPYESGSYAGAVGYEPIKIEPDTVTVSHSHPDHSYVDSLAGNPRIVNKTGKTIVKEVIIKGFSSFHDQQKGNARGSNIIFSFFIDGMNLVHLGDLGHQLEDTLIKEISPVDILLIPVGGVFTLGPKEANKLINSIEPKLVIPMHFKTEKLGFNIEPVDSFLRTIQFEREISNATFIEIKKETLPRLAKVLILRHSH